MEKVAEFLKESNAIEGVYDHQSLVDALKAWEYLIKQEHMDVAVLLTTHKLLMAKQNLPRTQRGHFRKQQVWVGAHEGMQWPLIPQLMAEWCNAMNFVGMGDAWKDMHVRFERIHPFIDGNGRVGRMLMNWFRIKRNNLPLLVIKERERASYYQWFKV